MQISAVVEAKLHPEPAKRIIEVSEWRFTEE